MKDSQILKFLIIRNPLKLLLYQPKEYLEIMDL